MFIHQISARSLTHAAPWVEQREKWSVSVPTFKEYMKFNGRLCASMYHIRATYTIQWWSNLVWRSVGVGALRIQTSQSPEQWGFHKVETWRVGLDKQENVCSRANNYVMGSWRDLSVPLCGQSLRNHGKGKPFQEAGDDKNLIFKMTVIKDITAQTFTVSLTHIDLI